MATSFKKKTTSRGRPNLPPGTKVSLHNNQLLISSGIPSFDALIGGGLPVGTLLMIEEDTYSSYSNVFQKLFLAEAVENGREIFIASSDVPPEDILKEIPCNATADNSTKQQQQQGIDQSQNDLKIAWRYQNTPKVSPGINAHQFGHYFDLSETLSEEKLKTVKCSCFNPQLVNSPKENINSTPRLNSYYKDLLRKIQTKVLSGGYSTNSNSVPPVLCICINALGSPCWNETLLTSDIYDPSLAWFLLALKAILRKSFASCLVTIPTHLFEDESCVKRLEYCCDIVVQLDSFAGSDKEQNPLFKEYHGLFNIRSQTQLNCITGQNIDTSDLAFKLKRKKFSIEKLHLPPDISETASRSQANTSSIKPGTPLCSVTTPVKNLLDF